MENGTCYRKLVTHTKKSVILTNLSLSWLGIRRKVGGKEASRRSHPEEWEITAGRRHRASSLCLLSPLSSSLPTSTTSWAFCMWSGNGKIISCGLWSPGSPNLIMEVRFDDKDGFSPFHSIVMEYHKRDDQRLICHNSVDWKLQIPASIWWRLIFASKMVPWMLDLLEGRNMCSPMEKGGRAVKDELLSF